MENDKPKLITQQDFKFVLAIVAFMIPVFLAWSSIETKLALIQQELSTIKNNDLAHIEIGLNDMKARNTVADDRQSKIELSVERLLTLHEK